MNRPILVLGYPVERPVDPGFGVDDGGDIDNSLPADPGHPWLPGHRPPHIDAGLPIPPLPPSLNPPPPQIWPPAAPIFPETPDHELPPPGAIWPPLPPGFDRQGKILVLIFISGVGWRWTILDTELSVDNSVPGAPAPK